MPTPANTDNQYVHVGYNTPLNPPAVPLLDVMYRRSTNSGRSIPGTSTPDGWSNISTPRVRSPAPQEASRVPLNLADFDDYMVVPEVVDVRAPSVLLQGSLEGLNRQNDASADNDTPKDKQSYLTADGSQSADTHTMHAQTDPTHRTRTAGHTHRNRTVGADTDVTRTATSADTTHMQKPSRREKMYCPSLNPEQRARRRYKGLEKQGKNHSSGEKEMS